jgi:DNA (cytosine-5)-methyltransferase 1
MLRGTVFRRIREELGAEGYDTVVWKLRAEEYGVPQRRTRVFLVGVRNHTIVMPPPPVTSFQSAPSLLAILPRVFSARDALEDLPPLSPGQDGSSLGYRKPATNPYQEYCRSEITARDLIELLGKTAR